jgi:putative ABC transport system permease protein
MDFIIRSVDDGIVTGLPFTMAFLGVWLVFRLQRDFDLTVDGTFSVGGAVATAWILQGGDPWLAMLLAAGSGALGGLLTYTLMRRLRLSLVLTSITVGLGLYSVALWILGQPNQSLVGKPTIFAWWTELTGLAPRTSLAIASLAALLVAGVYVLVSLFLRSEVGLALRASGQNQTMARTMGISPQFMLMISIVLGNALAGLSGALLAQQQGFADVTMGAGIILFGVTAVLLGEVVTGGFRAGRVSVIPVLLGALLYRTLLAAAFRAGVPPQFFQGMTAVIVLTSIAIGQLITSQRERRQAEKARAAFAVTVNGMSQPSILDPPARPDPTAVDAPPGETRSDD